MKRYPDSITITQIPEAVQGEDGNFSIPEGATTFTSDCRFRPVSGNNTIKGNDGEDIAYSYKVYMPTTDELFNFGDNVSGITHSGFIISGKVKKHFNRQYYTEVWV